MIHPAAGPIPDNPKYRRPAPEIGQWQWRRPTIAEPTPPQVTEIDVSALRAPIDRALLQVQVMLDDVRASLDELSREMDRTLRELGVDPSDD